MNIDVNGCYKIRFPRNNAKITIIVSALALFLGGCNGKGIVAEESPAMSLSSQETLFSEITEEDNTDWRDNSVDDLQAVVYVPVRKSGPRGNKMADAVRT